MIPSEGGQGSVVMKFTQMNDISSFAPFTLQISKVLFLISPGLVLAVENMDPDPPNKTCDQPLFLGNSSMSKAIHGEIHAKSATLIFDASLF